MSNKIKRTELKTHIYETPDTYAGGSDIISEKLPVMSGDSIVTKEINYIPVLYNMFNEILVNARDHYVRNKSEHQVTAIKVDLNPDNG